MLHDYGQTGILAYFLNTLLKQVQYGKDHSLINAYKVICRIWAIRVALPTFTINTPSRSYVF